MPNTVSKTYERIVKIANTKHQEEEDEETILLKPYNYVVERTESKFLTKCIKVLDYWLNVPIDKLAAISQLFKMLTTANLMVEDPEGDTAQKRGRPVPQQVFGIPMTLNTGSYVYLLCYKKVLDSFPPESADIFTRHFIDYLRGQGVELYHRDNNTCPDESQYMEMVQRKTGIIFDLCLQLMILFSDDKRDFKPLLDNLIWLYQIRNDLAHIYPDKYARDNKYREDVSENRFPLPVVHAVQTRPEDNTILEMLMDDKMSTKLVSKLEALGSFEHTLRKFREIRDEVIAETDKLGGNPMLDLILDYLKVD